MQWIKRITVETVRWAERRFPTSVLVALLLIPAAARGTYEWLTRRYFSGVSKRRAALIKRLRLKTTYRHTLYSTWCGHVATCLARCYRLWPDRLHEERWRARCTLMHRDRLEAAIATRRAVTLAMVHFSNVTEVSHFLRAFNYPIAFIRDKPPKGDAPYRIHLDSLADQVNGHENVPRQFTPAQIWEARDFLAEPGRVIAVLMDRRHPDAVLARGELFGMRFMSGGLRLAAMTNAVVVPCIIRAVPWLRSEICFGDPIPDELVANRTRHLEAFEHVLHQLTPYIIANPEQCAPHLTRAMDLDAATTANRPA